VREVPVDEAFIIDRTHRRGVSFQALHNLKVDQIRAARGVAGAAFMGASAAKLRRSGGGGVECTCDQLARRDTQKKQGLMQQQIRRLLSQVQGINASLPESMRVLHQPTPGGGAAPAPVARQQRNGIRRGALGQAPPPAEQQAADGHGDAAPGGHTGRATAAQEGAGASGRDPPPFLPPRHADAEERLLTRLDCRWMVGAGQALLRALLRVTQ
jgi:hypothetical protein